MDYVVLSGRVGIANTNFIFIFVLIFISSWERRCRRGLENGGV
jgi:hypothetical protein